MTTTREAQMIADLDLITREEAAAIGGIRPDTWSAYVSRGQAPRPTTHIGRTPLWDHGQVLEWALGRPRGHSKGWRP